MLDSEKDDLIAESKKAGAEKPSAFNAASLRSKVELAGNCEESWNDALTASDTHDESQSRNVSHPGHI